jgi:hypothetical protein
LVFRFALPPTTMSFLLLLVCVPPVTTHSPFSLPSPVFFQVALTSSPLFLGLDYVFWVTYYEPSLSSYLWT